MELNVIWIALACLIGGIGTGILGFLKAGQSFNLGRFAQTFWSALSAAIIFAIAYQFDAGGLSVYDILAAFLAGMGADNIVNRIVGISEN
jgi:hypothetical protein